MKLSQARELLSVETNLRKKAESERDGLGQKWELVRELISEGGGNTMNDDTRLRLAKLEAERLAATEHDDGDGDVAALDAAAEEDEDWTPRGGCHRRDPERGRPPKTELPNMLEPVWTNQIRGPPVAFARTSG